MMTFVKDIETLLISFQDLVSFMKHTDPVVMVVGVNAVDRNWHSPVTLTFLNTAQLLACNPESSH